MTRIRNRSRVLVLAGLALALTGGFAGWRRLIAPPMHLRVARVVLASCSEGSVWKLAALHAAGVPLDGEWVPPLLGLAAEGGHIGAMEYLAAHGAGLNQIGKFSTPLEHAIRGKHVVAVRWLLDRGARPDREGDEVPLVLAVRSCQPEVARLLVERGAPPLADPEATLASAAHGACPRLAELRSLVGAR